MKTIIEYIISLGVLGLGIFLTIVDDPFVGVILIMIGLLALGVTVTNTKWSISSKQ